MKKKFSIISIVAILLVLIYIQSSNSRFDRVALARGEELNKSVDVSKYYEASLRGSINNNKIKMSHALNDIKRAEIKNNKENVLKYDVDISIETNFKDVFKDCLFIGDSLTSGLYYYKYLDKANVMADLGFNVKKIRTNKLEDIKAAAPKRIFIMLGTNDLVHAKDSDKFIKSYEGLIEDLNRILPKTKLYITSILPVDSRVKEATDKINNELISSTNDRLNKLAKDKKISFIDLRPYIAAHTDFYAKDGIHINRHFYKYWLKFIEVNFMGGN
ncbi:MAG: GDSL-type esterase/lipase family protein [Ezakiella sp.]|nr:GDSL-type esterase/lipase family protein [Bacillota bacterium]MDY3946919.1 GDSL-type esterase/lipase family protein [Ezakiella sp.]